MADPTPANPKKRTFQAPTGTRDFYPREMLIRRYITDAWRRTSLRHGFEEVDGPTFESADLYKVKSGEGILNEMFGVFSGKAEGARRAVEPGAPATGSPEDGLDPRNPPFGLRPEFTPTLARMYAARAKQLPQPTKWFCVSNFFRAERPQRGRLREFWQWNADIIGGEENLSSDVEVMGCLASMLDDLGLSSTRIEFFLNDRRCIAAILSRYGVPDARLQDAFTLLDLWAKVEEAEFRNRSAGLGITSDRIDDWLGLMRLKVSARETIHHVHGGSAPPRPSNLGLIELDPLHDAIMQSGLSQWCQYVPSLARGLAYYTGTVFEVIAEGERAVAGGGRYDNLIELFGGPPTPACGFGMGDAVLGNLLEDRKLIPEGREMLEALARPMPYRPDVFVIASPNPGCEELIVPTVARLRRGEESEIFKQGECMPWSAGRYTKPPLHARRSYKATKNVGKLLADAGACHARYAAIIETPETCSLKNLDTGEQHKDVPLTDLARRVNH